MSDYMSKAVDAIKSVAPPLPSLSSLPGEHGGLKVFVIILTIGWFCLLVKDYAAIEKIESGKDATAQSMMVALDSMMLVFCLMYLFIGHKNMISLHKWTTVIVAFIVLLYTIMWLVQGSPSSWLNEDDRFKGSSAFAKANTGLGLIFALTSLGYFGFVAFKALKHSGGLHEESVELAQKQ